MVVKKNHNDGVSDADASSHMGMSNRRKDNALTNLRNDVTRRESAVVEDDAAVLGREKRATAREDAADLREGAATAREQDIRAGETLQTGFDDHVQML